jgi:hypothetical protein
LPANKNILSTKLQKVLYAWTSIDVVDEVVVVVVLGCCRDNYELNEAISY